MPAPPSVLADPPSARTIRFASSCSAARMASPSPAEEAASGASVPPGRVCRPQVLATSTTAVTPSKAIAAGWRSPVAAATSTSSDRKPAATAAATLPSPPSASGSPS